MPIYQYVCTECGTPLEVSQSFTDPALTECGVCGGRLRKQFSSVGVVFKGSGFYRNDSREKHSRAPVNGTPKPDRAERSESATGAAAKAGSAGTNGSGPDSKPADNRSNGTKRTVSDPSKSVSSSKPASSTSSPASSTPSTSS